MERHFHEALKDLKQRILKMGLLVEEAIDKSIESLLQRDTALAKEVIEGDQHINHLEIEIDDMGHGLLALGQPMAVDLRVITMILKINTDLERMGDHAVNIAEKALVLSQDPPLKADIHLPQMGTAVKKMLRDALLSFVNSDADLARSVLSRDDEVDAYNDSLYDQVRQLMEKDKTLIKRGMNLVMIGHNLERVADLSNNIAEDVIYMKQGKEVRHHVEAEGQI